MAFPNIPHELGKIYNNGSRYAETTPGLTIPGAILCAGTLFQRNVSVSVPYVNKAATILSNQYNWCTLSRNFLPFMVAITTGKEIYTSFFSNNYYARNETQGQVFMRFLTNLISKNIFHICSLVALEYLIKIIPYTFNSVFGQTR